MEPMPRRGPGVLLSTWFCPVLACLGPVLGLSWACLGPVLALALGPNPWRCPWALFWAVPWPYSLALFPAGALILGRLPDPCG